MKRFLSWIALIVCYTLLCFVVHWDLLFVAYVLAFFKIMPFILRVLAYCVGGTMLLALIFTPVIYGTAITVSLCEGICPSKKGTRYVVMGVLIILMCLLEAVTSFYTRDIVIGIYGAMLIFSGKTSKQ